MLFTGSTGDLTFSVLFIITKPSGLPFSEPERKSNTGDSEDGGVPGASATKKWFPESVNGISSLSLASIAVVESSIVV